MERKPLDVVDRDVAERAFAEVMGASGGNGRRAMITFLSLAASVAFANGDDFGTVLRELNAVLDWYAANTRSQRFISDVEYVVQERK